MTAPALLRHVHTLGRPSGFDLGLVVPATLRPVLTVGGPFAFGLAVGLHTPFAVQHLALGACWGGLTALIVALAAGLQQAIRGRRGR